MSQRPCRTTIIDEVLIDIHEDASSNWPTSQNGSDFTPSNNIKGNTTNEMKTETATKTQHPTHPFPRWRGDPRSAPAPTSDKATPFTVWHRLLDHGGRARTSPNPTIHHIHDTLNTLNHSSLRTHPGDGNWNTSRSSPTRARGKKISRNRERGTAPKTFERKQCTEKTSFNASY